MDKEKHSSNLDISVFTEIFSYVQRRHNQENRRVVNVYTTKEGEKLFKQKENQVKQQLSETLSVLSLEDYQEVNQHFLAVMKILSNYQALRRKTCKENNAKK